MTQRYRHPYLGQGVGLRDLGISAVLVLAACLGGVLLLVVLSWVVTE